MKKEFALALVIIASIFISLRASDHNSHVNAQTQARPSPTPARPQPTLAVDLSTATLVKRVAQSNMEATVKHLAAYPSRHSKGKHVAEVAAWLVAQLKSFGYTDVRLQPFMLDGVTLNNVVCTKPGSGASGTGETKAQTIIVGAHYDSRMERGDDPLGRAPGADDNASGVAAVLEAARVLAGVKTKDAIQFVFFCGEEQGLHGSMAMAGEVKQKKIPVRFMLNLDMVAVPPPDGTLIIEQDNGNAIAANDESSKRLAAEIARLAKEHTRLPIKSDRIYDSDYMPFEALGITTVGFFHGDEYEFYHKSADTPDKLNFPYMTEVAKLTVATLLLAQ